MLKLGGVSANDGGLLLLLRSGLLLYLPTWNWFPHPFSLKLRIKQVLLDAFLQLLDLHVVDTDPAGTGISLEFLQCYC